jgi:glycosyltransferase involved in cell wall biosynthesis
MKILFLGTESIGLNGSSQHMAFLAKAVAELGVEVTIALPDLPENRAFVAENLPGIQWRPFPSGSPWQEIAAKHRLAKAGHYDVIHSFCLGVRCVLVRSALRGSRRPLVIYDWDELFSVHYKNRFWTLAKHKLVETYSLAFGDGYTAASQYLYDYMSRRVGRRGRDRVLLLPVGYDPVMEDRTFASAALGTIESDFAQKKLVYVGALTTGYQIGELIELGQEIKAHQLPWKIFIVGRGPDEARFKQTIAERGLEGQLSLTGWVPVKAIGAILRAADVLLFPITPTEQNIARCPLKIFQYMASRIPVVTNRVGEVGRALGKWGYYYTSDDAADFRQKCADAISGGRTVPYPAACLEQLTWGARAREYRDWLVQRLSADGEE